MGNAKHNVSYGEDTVIIDGEAQIRDNIVKRQLRLTSNLFLIWHEGADHLDRHHRIDSFSIQIQIPTLRQPVE